MQYDDHGLVSAFKEGDELAFVSLYNRYKAPVFAFCCKMLDSREMAQDSLQETFIRVYENRDRLLNSHSFRSWLFTIARNQCLNQLRRTGRHVSIDLTSQSMFRGVENETPFSELAKSEQVELVNLFLKQLKPEHREVLILREYQNLSYEEIAAVTRTTISSVKSRLFKARRRLGVFMAPLLRDEGVKEESKAAAGVKNE